MAVNKVVYDGNTLVDLTSDTVTPETLVEGETAHNAAGEKITGTAKIGGAALPAGGLTGQVLTKKSDADYDVYWTDVGGTVPSVPPEADTLDKCSWENISQVVASGVAGNYWTVGDCKKIKLTGTIGTVTLSEYEVFVYIIGFNHNGTKNTVDFGTFKDVDEPFDSVALNDSKIGTNSTDGSKYFNTQHWGASNHGGWAGSDVRYDIFGSVDVAPSDYGSAVTAGRTGGRPSLNCATNPVPNTLMSALPADLRAVMKPITVYTDNVGGGNGNVADNVTSSVDYLPALSEYEVFGSITDANSHEETYQEQYAYYAAGNPTGKRRYASTGACAYRLRSPAANSGANYCRVGSDGNAGSGSARLVVAIAPFFRV